MAESTMVRSECVQRGPDWIYVRLSRDKAYNPDDANIGTALWNLLSCNHSHRMVVELDDVSQVPSQLLDELSSLSRRLHERGGVLRLSGLTDVETAKIDQRGLKQDLPCFTSREEAVRATRSSQPR